MMKNILAVCCALCILWLCACTAQPSADWTETATQSPSQIVASEAQPADTQSETIADEHSETSADLQTATQTETTVPQPAKISVSLADSAIAVPNSVHVTADKGEPAVHMLFTTDRAVRYVQVLSLMMKDFDEDTGKPVYDVTTVGSINELTPEQPLVVTTVFYGDLPNNGISYVDADGSVHRFAVEMSGEDGSLFLSEF